MLGSIALPRGWGPDAVVVLGCRLYWTPARTLAGAIGRRAQSAARLVLRLETEGQQPRFVACGWRAWSGVIEADALAKELARLGVPIHRIERERRSCSTKANARHVAALLAPGARVAVVTCDWHMSRAAALFRAEGLDVHPVPTLAGDASWARR